MKEQKVKLLTKVKQLISSSSILNLAVPLSAPCSFYLISDDQHMVIFTIRLEVWFLNLVLEIFKEVHTLRISLAVLIIYCYAIALPAQSSKTTTSLFSPLMLWVGWGQSGSSVPRDISWGCSHCGSLLLLMGVQCGSLTRWASWWGQRLTGHRFPCRLSVSLHGLPCICSLGVAYFLHSNSELLKAWN